MKHFYAYRKSYKQFFIISFDTRKQRDRFLRSKRARQMKYNKLSAYDMYIITRDRAIEAGSIHVR